MFSFVCFLTREPRWLVDHVMELEAEVRGVSFDYDHWLEVWSLRCKCPFGYRVGYLPGSEKLGYVMTEEAEARAEAARWARWAK